jgi:hypothetical protein
VVFLKAKKFDSKNRLSDEGEHEQRQVDHTPIFIDFYFSMINNHG